MKLPDYITQEYLDEVLTVPYKGVPFEELTSGLQKRALRRLGIDKLIVGED
jgi:hypothetical protein